MCIICYKPQNIKMIDVEYFKNCEMFNRDGAGFMVIKDETVHIKKGYFDANQLYNDIFKETDNEPEKYHVGVHFRFATHGVTDKGNCHPFSISKRARKLRNIDVNTNFALMHNGVISGMQADPLLSDTQMFIRSNYRELQNKPKTVLNRTDGKFLYFSPNFVYTKGLTEDMGWLWSNDGYMDYKSYKYKSFNSGYSLRDEYSIWGDDYYDSEYCGTKIPIEKTGFDMIAPMFDENTKQKQMMKWLEMSEEEFIEEYLDAYDNRMCSAEDAEYFNAILELTDRLDYNIDE